MGEAAAPPRRRRLHVVARDDERACVDRFLAGIPAGARALVLRGEPGIGKTTLWGYGLDECRRREFEVLVTRPAEEEMGLALVGLVDLFDGHETAAPGKDDAFARGRLVLGELRRLAGSRPVVVAIDDLQWLDSASAAALRYALRRLDAEPVGVLATARTGADRADALKLTTVLGPARADTLDLGPLSVGALRGVLGDSVAISRPALRRIHELSGGNPLYAIELARGLADDQGVHRAWSGHPLPESLQEAVAGRLAAVPAELVPLLESVSAIGPTSLKELRSLLPDVQVDELLILGERHGLLVVEEDLGVRFSHPLVNSAVYAAMSALERRSLHAQLAARAADADARARHLALSADEPDAAIADLLEAAGERARRRGAPDLAAAFAHHSRRLTPKSDPEAARRRALTEIGNLGAAGQVSSALALADRLIAELPAGPGRADALVRRAQLEDEDLQRGEAFLLQALDDAREDPVLRAQVLDQLGWLRGIFRGDLHAGIESAREAVAIADGAGDPELQMSAASGLAVMSALAGEPQPELMASAVALQDEIGRPLLWAGPRTLLAEQLLWSGELSSARDLLEDELADALRTGNERWRLYDLYDLASVECAAGRLVRADELVQQAIEAARDSEDAHVESWIRQRLAQVAAWLGRAEEARAAAGRRLEDATRRKEKPGIARMRSLLGLLALSEGDAETARRELAEAARLLDEIGLANPGAVPGLPDAIEALSACGDTAAAGALLERLEAQADALDSPWPRAVVERCRGMLLLSRGQADDAVAPLTRATESFDALGYGPDAARAVLALGRSHLRSGRRTVAAETLADAHRRFAVMGAALWEARALEELERAAPGRVAGELTSAERRVAALVARGLRNREIGQSLFMSVATVEAHLTRIYRKLDIRSRSELARLVADGSVAVSDEQSSP